jgi:hypothetical protein
MSPTWFLRLGKRLPSSKQASTPEKQGFFCRGNRVCDLLWPAQGMVFAAERQDTDSGREV